jgi:enoyl-CoA hydratase/carnithine racemase
MEVWKPVIAAVNGYCMGGGLTLLFATDIRIAVEGAVFGLSEVKRGLVPGNGGTQRVMRQFPYAIAMEILLTGDRFGTDLAERWGLVNAVVPRAKLMPTAYD